MSSFSRVLKNFAAIFFADSFGRLIGLATAVMLARYLGPEDYGKYALITSFTYLFMVLSDFGLNDLIVMDVAKNYSIARKYLVSGFIIKVVFSCLGIVFLNLSIYLMGYSKEIVLCTAVFSAHILFITLTNVVSSIVKAFERMEYASLIAIIHGIVGLTFIVALIYFQATLLEIIFSRVLTFFIGFAIGFVILVKKFVKPDFSFDYDLIKKMIGRAFPFLMLAIISTLYFKVDIIMLSKIKGELYVGWYTPAANDLFFGIYVIPRAVSTVTFPLFSKQYAKNVDQLRASCNYTIKLITILGVAISAGTVILAPQIINIIFGPLYQSSIIVLQIIAPAISFAFIRDPLSYALAAAGGVKILMWINLLALTMNILLNAILIPIYSHVGAAITSAFCILLSLLATYFYLNMQIQKINLIKNFFKPMVAALIMCTGIHFLKGLNLLVLIFVGAILYMSVIFVLKTFSSSELFVLKGLFKRS